MVSPFVLRIIQLTVEVKKLSLIRLNSMQAQRFMFKITYKDFVSVHMQWS